MPRKTILTPEAQALLEPNVYAITIKGQARYRARLVFAHDPVLGTKREPKDFIGKTAAEAVEKRRAYQALPPDTIKTDKTTKLLDYVRDVFIPEQEAKAERGEQDLPYTKTRKSRINSLYLDPTTPAIKNCDIRKVTVGLLSRLMVKEYFAALVAAKVHPVSIKRLRDDFKLITRALFDDEKISIRPADLFEGIFEAVNVPRVRKPKHKSWSTADIAAKITDKSLPLADRCLVAFEFFVQCRPSEMFSLDFQDLDLETGSVWIGKAVRLTPSGFDVVDGTKTDTEESYRVVYFHPALTGMLRELRDAVGGKERPSMPVFRTFNGKRFNKDNFKSNWKRTKATLGLPDGPSFYTLKRLGNSYALANGVSPAAQAAKMGHSSDRMATSVYRELMAAERQASTSVFDPLVALPSGS